jgi:hypothetical protein
VQAGFKQQKISTAVFVGHGNVNTIGLDAQRGKDGKVTWKEGATPQGFAEMAGVRKGGVAAYLSCNVVNGNTSSESALANKGITSIGYDRKFYFRGDGLVQSPDRRVHIDPNAPLSREEPKEDPWFRPAEIDPAIQSGPNPIKDGSVGDHVTAAEGRVNPKEK